MKSLVILFVLVLASGVARGEFTCLDGTSPACLDDGDTVCPASAKCVAGASICFDEHSCDSESGYICGSEYDEMLSSYKAVVSQYNQLTAENVDLREKQLNQRNCVINAQTLKEAIKCVRNG